MMTLLQTRFSKLFFVGCLIAVVVLSACNLQQSDVTPTLNATSQSPQATATSAQIVPTLRPTPTSLPLASVGAVTPPPGIPTVIPLGGGTPGNGTIIPTLNPTDADQRYEMTVKDGK